MRVRGTICFVFFHIIFELPTFQITSYAPSITDDEKLMLLIKTYGISK